MSSKLTTLLAFAKRGVGIVPLTPVENVPVVAGGAKAAVTDPKTLRAFYEKRPKYNYGLALGDGVFAIRVNDNHSKARLHKLAADHGERLPKTPTLRIDKARLYLFAAKGTQLGSGLIEKGIEVLGTGEYVPGPGSSLPSGGKSRFASGRTLSDVEIATAPAWLLQIIGAAPTDPTDAGGASTAKEPEGTSSGDGNSVRPSEQRLISIPIAAISVDAARQLDPDHVRLLEDSIEILGLRTPITVMRKKDGGAAAGPAIFDLVTGYARLVALRNRGVTWVDVFVFDGDETDAKLWAAAENVDRRVLSVIEIADRIAEFDRLLVTKLGKVVQDAPPGGVQPADTGLRKAARRLGISREKMRRHRLVSDLSAQVKAEAKRLGLGNQSALLDAAKEKTPEGQISKLRARAAARKGATGRKGGRPKKKEHVTQGDDMSPATDVKQLKTELAAARERMRKFEEELETARRTVSHTPAVDESAKASMDGDIPPFLDRRPLSPDDQKALDELVGAWDQHVQPLWTNASAVIRERFRASRIIETSR
jgi:hypothetical protein